MNVVDHSLHYSSQEVGAHPEVVYFQLMALSILVSWDPVSLVTRRKRFHEMMASMSVL